MKTIVVPVDLSAAAARVVKSACELARHTRAGLLLVHIVEPPVVVSDIYGMEGAYFQESISAATQVGKRRLKAMARTCEKRGLRTKTYQSVGAPVPEILRLARKAAFIVMGSHGHGAVFELLVGSTTQGVLRRAPCPVMVVPITAPR